VCAASNIDMNGGDVHRGSIRIAWVAFLTTCCWGLTGCLVAGYSSGSGIWVWPGSIVITLVLALIWFLTRR
jgi:hypothetical protein